MKKKHRYLCLAAAAAVMIFGSTAFGSSISADENYTLGKAGRYHIFARNISLNAHTNGNIAAETLENCNSIFGTSQILNSGGTETSYIKNIGNIMSSSWADPLIVGSGVEIISMDNGNAVGLRTANGDIKLDRIKNVIQDDDYIDFDNEFSYLEKVSEHLAGLDSQNASYDGSDFNNASLTAEGSMAVYTISSSELSRINQLNVKNADLNSGTVIINVDLSDVESAEYTVPVKTYITDTEGNSYYNSERGTFEKSRVLWNFYGYDGKISFAREWMGTILAPDASIQANSNIDGSIICQSFVNYGETHRWDFSGIIPGNIEDSGNTGEDEPAVPEPSVFRISGKIVWSGFENIPSGTYRISLMLGDEEISTVETDSERDWSYEFNDIEETENGPEDYTVRISSGEVDKVWEVNIVRDSLDDSVIDIHIETEIPEEPVTPENPDQPEPGETPEEPESPEETPDVPEETPDTPEETPEEIPDMPAEDPDKNPVETDPEIPEETGPGEGDKEEAGTATGESDNDTDKQESGTPAESLRSVQSDAVSENPSSSAVTASPDTGDTSSILKYAATIAAAVTATAVYALKRRKNQNMR